MTSVGWPYLILAVLLIVIAAPVVIDWLRFEIRLARRARRVAPKHRSGWPYW